MRERQFVPLLMMVAALLLEVNVPKVAAQKKSSGRIPRFQDYRAAGSDGVGSVFGIARPGHRESTAQFQKRLRRAARRGVNFAGHYAIVGWSCGMICVNLAIVDVRSRRIYDTPFVGIGDGPCPNSYIAAKPEMIEFRPDSRLLILRGSAEDPVSGHSFADAPCSTRYYVWNGTRLVLRSEDLYR